LSEARRVQARFSATPAPLPELPGLLVCEQQDHRLTLEYQGPLPELLGWLARQPVADVRIEPLGLAPIYHRYHGAET
jgi:ABC-2 type transport system ATP-binding protein